MLGWVKLTGKACLFHLPVGGEQPTPIGDDLAGAVERAAAPAPAPCSCRDLRLLPLLLNKASLACTRVSGPWGSSLPNAAAP